MWTRCTRTSPQEFSTSDYTILQSPQLLKGVMQCCVAAEARTNDGGFCRQVWIRYHIRRYICSQSAIGNADGRILGSRKVCNLLLGDRVKMWLPPIISVMVLRWCVTDSGGKLSGIHLRCKRDVNGAIELWYLVVFRACWVITNRAAVLLQKKKKSSQAHFTVDKTLSRMSATIGSSQCITLASERRPCLALRSSLQEYLIASKQMSQMNNS